MAEVDKNTPIKEWARDEQPREKLIDKGPGILTNAELLAILISTGTPKYSAIDLGRKILQLVDGDLIALGRLTVKDLMKINGIGEAKAVTIVTAMELGRRRLIAEVPSTEILNSPEKVAGLMGPRLADLMHEEFHVLYLKQNLQLIKDETVCVGGLTSTLVDVRLVMRHALENLAVSMILVHNHPSGNPKPSEADKRLTSRIKEAAAMLDIKVADHIIVAGRDRFSFNDEGLL